MDKYDVVVIGAGIAGITSAIYLKRANLKVLIIESNTPGGQLNKISKIENYPGFTEISGPQLAENLLEQVKKLNIEYHYGNVIEIKNEPEKIVITDQEEIKTKYIILAMGRKPNQLNLENEKKLLNKGISYCALCDGPLFKNMDVAVVGSGNSAIEESIYLSKICKSVTLIVRSEKLKADEKSVDILKKQTNVRIKYNSVITTLLQKNDKLEGIEINNEEIINVDGLFVYIGSTPNIDFLDKLNIEQNNKYILVDKNMKTSIDGIYACGDIIKKDIYQLTTAVSEATIAAISIKKENK